MVLVGCMPQIWKLHSVLWQMEKPHLESWELLIMSIYTPMCGIKYARHFLYLHLFYGKIVLHRRKDLEHGGHQVCQL